MWRVLFCPLVHIILKRKEVFVIKRILALLLCIIICVLPLPSCTAKEPVSCRAVLGAMVDKEIGLPAGQIYDLSAPLGNDEYLDERVISALFGEGSTPPMRAGWLDLALFLPNSSHPCEFAVFLCDSADTATDTARLLCRRLDVVKSTKKNDANALMLSSAAITIMGNYVLFIISSDTDGALKTATGILK